MISCVFFSFRHVETCALAALILGPVHTYPDIFKSATFSFGYGYRPHVSGEFDSESVKK